MAYDPVEEARKRQKALLNRSTYFPAANLSQFEGTELAPPGGGTYYNPSRYAGAPANLQRRAASNLANAYQQDLAFNVQANPRVAAGLQAERIGAQYGGRGSFEGRPGYTTVYTPGGGSAVVSDAVANRMVGKNAGYSLSKQPSIAQIQTLANFDYAGNWQKGFGSDKSPYPQQPQPLAPTISNLGGLALRQIGTLGYNAFNSLFNRPNQQQNQNYYAYNPSPVPQQPRRYFDF